MPQTRASQSVAVLFLMLLTHTLTTAFYVKFDRKRTGKKGLRILIKNVDLTAGKSKPPGAGANLPYYANLTKLSADERCLTGKPLGAAMSQYRPYTYIQPFMLSQGKQRPEMGIAFLGILPSVLKKALGVCCHKNSTVEFAKYLKQMTVDVSEMTRSHYDFYFPLYGDGMDDTMYRERPYLPIVQAPSVALLVRSDNSTDGKTKFIAVTIFKAWPLLLLMLLLSLIFGIVFWFLEYKENREEFPRRFVQGAWEGLWMAFITMTTVGYGDRTPKSRLGRLLSILWMISGLVIVAIFGGRVTAAFEASTRTRFEVHGAKIAAINGSKDFQLGLNLNAKMIAYDSTLGAIAALETKDVDGVLVDNYVVSHNSDRIIKKSFRLERWIKHPITYGIMFGQNSSYLEGCVRKFVRDHPLEVFEILKSHLKNQENIADKINLKLQKAKKLFNTDETVKEMLIYGSCSLAVLIAAAQLLQFLYRKSKGKALTQIYGQQVVSNVEYRFGSFQRVDNSVNDLIEQYQCFQRSWISRFKALHDD